MKKFLIVFLMLFVFNLIKAQTCYFVIHTDSLDTNELKENIYGDFKAIRNEVEAQRLYVDKFDCTIYSYLKVGEEKLNDFKYRVDVINTKNELIYDCTRQISLFCDPSFLRQEDKINEFVEILAPDFVKNKESIHFMIVEWEKGEENYHLYYYDDKLIEIK